MPTLEQARELIQKNSPRPFALEFKRLSDHAIQCKCCGKFYIVKVTQNGIDTFECWFKESPAAQAVCLRQNLPTGTDAKSWIGAMASAYAKGNLNLRAPPTRAEIEAEQLALNRLKETA